MLHPSIKCFGKNPDDLNWVLFEDDRKKGYLWEEPVKDFEIIVYLCYGYHVYRNKHTKIEYKVIY